MTQIVLVTIKSKQNMEQERLNNLKVGDNIMFVDPFEPEKCHGYAVISEITDNLIICGHGTIRINKHDGYVLKSKLDGSYSVIAKPMTKEDKLAYDYNATITECMLSLQQFHYNRQLTESEKAVIESLCHRIESRLK
jgi:hypothetical protein